MFISLNESIYIIYIRQFFVPFTVLEDIDEIVNVISRVSGFMEINVYCRRHKNWVLSTACGNDT